MATLHHRRSLWESPAFTTHDHRNYEMPSEKSNKLKSLKGSLLTGISPLMLGFATVGTIFGLGAYFVPRFTILTFMLIGYAAVWARSNTREEIFDAFRRREVYATTGPRMSVRFFGGWAFAANDALRDRLVPVNRKFPIRELLAACRRYLERLQVQKLK